MFKKINSAIWLITNIRWYALYRLSLLRYLICRIRQFYYIKIKKNLRTWQGDQQHLYIFKNGQKTIDYNLTGLHDVSCARALRLIRPLSCIETYRPLKDMPRKGGTLYDLDYITDAKVLTIGPRTEGELFCLRAYGFKKSNIRGLDLISYSPKIDLGDMHSMHYNDHSFDIVIASCVLSYSLEQQKAANEIRRVLKPGGLICFSHDVNPNTINQNHPKVIDDYLVYFKGYIQRIFYQHELPENLASNIPSTYTCSIIFQLN